MPQDPFKLQAALEIAEKQLVHVTSLLNESESNVDRLAEQTKVLKEEIRRSQRNDKRETVNLEYLKNVVIKFLQFREEREQLLPVVATILQFSPEELRALKRAQTEDSARAAADSWGALFPRFS